MRLPAVVRSPSPYLLLVMTTLFWAGNFVLARATHETIPPLALSFWRWAVAFVMLLPFALPYLVRDRALIRANAGRLVVLAILGVANYNSFVYIGLQTTTATNAVLMASTTPVLIVALAFLLLGQTITTRQFVGIITSMLGVACIVLEGDLSSLATQQINRGDLWVIAAGLSWAAYSVLLIRWRVPGLHPLAFLATTIGVGALALAPLNAAGVAAERPFEPGWVSVGTILYVALFASLLAFICWNRAVAELGPARTGQFLHLMPAFGAILSMLLLGERLHPYHLAGIALIATGIWLATVMRGRRR